MGVGVDGYSADNLTNKVYSKYSTNKVDTNMNGDETSSYLDFNGYLKLLTAQMSNQDFNNSMSDSEFIQQMASYSMMEAISQLTQQTAISYSSSLIGKAVTVFDGSSYDTGVVEAVTVSGGECKLLVNGSQYSPDSITDVIDGDVYLKLNSFVGYNVEIKDGDSTITGKVTGVLIKNGNGFVILDNKNAYSMSAITKVFSDEDEDNSSESGSESDKTDGEGSASVDESPASYYAASGEKEGVVSRSGSSLDDLMKILDGEDISDSNVISAYASAAVKGALESYSSANVDESAAASGLVSDRIPAPSVYNQYYKQSGNTQSNNVSASSASSGLASSRIPAPSVYNEYYKKSNITQSNISASNANSTYDSGDVYGVTNVSDMNAQSSSLEQFHEENVAGSEFVIPSSRKYAEDYPLEAAFADEMGTKMADIRFIGNTRINSVIDTSEIICYSEKGRPVTDIGWCGKGLLGEVVTYADGTQRVEIIGPTEVSYLYTSGNLTLDEICDQNAAPGSLVGKLTPFETAIRHYAREYSAAEQAEMDRFGEFCARHAYFNNLG